MKNKYDIGSAINRLNKSNNISADQGKRTVTIQQGEKSNGGLKVLSAVDYLVNHHSYMLLFERKA